MSSTTANTASSVAQVQKGHVRGLGRGPRSKNKLQSPKDRPLRIIQYHINGISTCAVRIKLDQILEIAEEQNAQIIALQEAKSKETHKIKAEGCNIVRKDRQDKGGGVLAFLIININFASINTSSTTDSDLELQGITLM
ncbi:uncharacterized protein TNCV_3429961 [Trichonephila clavipes]|nr:uncharacterized protein TNCV_3429961 [Trichonephila clavipes]